MHEEMLQIAVNGRDDLLLALKRKWQKFAEEKKPNEEQLNPNFQNRQKKTALHICAGRNIISYCKFDFCLTERGHVAFATSFLSLLHPRTQIRDETGRTPFQIAKDKGDTKMMTCLQEYR